MILIHHSNNKIIFIASFHLFNSRLTRNHNLFHNYRLQVHVIENFEESNEYEKLNNKIDTILIIYTMKRYTIENYEYSKMSKQIKLETWSTVYHKNDEVTIYTNLTEANNFLKSVDNNILSEEESINAKDMKFEVSYFLVLPIQKFINPDTLINLASFHSNVSLLRINSERMYIDLRDCSYNKSFNQNIKMLILNVNKIYGFNSMENYEGYFEVDEEFKQIDFWPTAYSLFIFLVLTRLIYSLDIIWISNSLKLNRGELNIFINKWLDNTKKISINEFDAFKLDNFDDKISKSDSTKCQKEFIFNNESKNKYDFMVDKLDTKNVNKCKSKFFKLKIIDPNKKKNKK